MDSLIMDKGTILEFVPYFTFSLFATLVALKKNKKKNSVKYEFIKLLVNIK